MYRAKQRLMFYELKSRQRRGRAIIEMPNPIPDGSEVLAMPAIEINSGRVDIESLLERSPFYLNADPTDIQHIEHMYQGWFSKDIPPDIPTFDIRSVWEPSRLQHLSILLAWLNRNDKGGPGEDLAEFIRENILAWIDKNPFLLGPHYMCAMECALRIPVFFYSLKCLKNFENQERSTILKAIYQHAWWVARNLSLFSSLGNHTVCECMGLIFAGAIFREEIDGRRWLDEGIRLLRQESSHQILDDGGPAEQSFAYHRFVLDLYWLAIDFLEKNDLADFSEVKERLLLGEHFLACFADSNGAVPAIGDSDDGFAVAPCAAPIRIVPKAQPGVLTTFHDSGYSVIRLNKSYMLTFDHGPLGMAPLYNHGHADALSVTLRIGCHDILIDPGTFRYNNYSRERAYFKSTRAHNTVCIDNIDQAVQETGFIWSHPYEVKLLRAGEYEKGIVLSALHTGYARIKLPVSHKRTINIIHHENIIIQDTFTGSGSHIYELNYHLHPSCTVESEGVWWKVKNADTTLNMALSGSGNIHVICGQDFPMLGWYSPSYGVIEKCPVISCTREGQPHEVSFITVICMNEKKDINWLVEKAGIL